MRRLLFPLLAVLLFSGCKQVDTSEDKIHKQCLKAADYAGCVQLNSGSVQKEIVRTKIVNDLREKLLLEIKKLPSRLAYSNALDYRSRTMSFTDALAISSPEEVGDDLYLDARRLARGIDILYEVWEKKRNVEKGALDHMGRRLQWHYPENFALKGRLDKLFKRNTIEIKCKTYTIFFVRKDILSEDVFDQVYTLLVSAAKNIGANGKLIWEDDISKPLTFGKNPDICPAEPRL